MISLLLIPLALGGVVHNCDAIQPNVERYTVNGDTSDTIRTQLGKACGPSGDCFDGYIQYFLSEPITCSNGIYRVFLGNRIQMPSLGQTNNEVLKRNFGIFSDALYQHELNHLENGKKTCQYFVDQLQKDSGCSLPLESIQRIQSNGWDLAKNLDTEYDSRTRHGMTEGVCFGLNCTDDCVGCRDRFVAGNSVAPPNTVLPEPVTSTVATTTSVATSIASVDVTVSTVTTGGTTSTIGTTTASAIVGSATHITGSGSDTNHSDASPGLPPTPPKQSSSFRSSLGLLWLFL